MAGNAPNLQMTLVFLPKHRLAVPRRLLPLSAMWLVELLFLAKAKNSCAVSSGTPTILPLHLL